MLTKAEIAQKYKVTPRLINVWMANKTIPFVKVGGIVRFREEDVDKALEKLTVRARTDEGGASK